MVAAQTLIEELRRHALVIGEVTLSSGAKAQYYVDAKRAILRPAGFVALAELVAGYARQWEATAVGGAAVGARPTALPRGGGPGVTPGGGGAPPPPPRRGPPPRRNAERSIPRPRSP